MFQFQNTTSTPIIYMFNKVYSVCEKKHKSVLAISIIIYNVLLYITSFINTFMTYCMAQLTIRHLRIKRFYVKITNFSEKRFKVQNGHSFRIN